MNVKNQNIMVSPVYRKAALAQIIPAPKKPQAFHIAKVIIKEWDRLGEEYKEKVSSITKISENKIQYAYKEKIRIRKEKKAVVVDFPRLFNNEKESLNFDARICIAICTRQLSTKYWSRVGFPYDDLIKVSYKPDSLDSSTILFRHITDYCSEWLLKRTRKIIEDKLGFKVSPLKYNIEIISIGSYERKLSYYFNKLSDPNINVLELLEKHGADGIFSTYFNKFTDIKGSLLSSVKKSPDCFWLSSPMVFEDSKGHFNRSHFLYLVRSKNNSLQALGLGYDMSRLRNLSQRSSLKVARLLGGEI